MNNKNNNNFKKQNEGELAKEQQKLKLALRDGRDAGALENSRENQKNHSNREFRDNLRQKYGRDNPQRQHGGYYNSSGRSPEKPKTVETIEDIKADISRIEKEIKLEIKEIKSMRLGL